MWANKSGIQAATLRRIGLAWLMTMPAAILLSAGLFIAGGAIFPSARSTSVTASAPDMPAGERAR